MKRGEVWWAELEGPAGRRPVILISRDDAYLVRSLVIIAPVTTRIRGIDSEVLLGAEDGLPRKCVANLDSLSTVPKSALRSRLTTLSQEKIRQVDVAIHFTLGLDV
jgi:mRNA interferase MazF